jgi:hypothetical protein
MTTSLGRSPRRTRNAVLSVTALLAAIAATAEAQSSFGNLAAGPYNRLVIRGAMVIPGHGGPPAGPYDIVIERNMITQMVPFDPVSAEREQRQRPTTPRASTSCRA